MKYLINILFLIIAITITVIFINDAKQDSIQTQQQILIKEAKIYFYDQVNTRHWNAKFGGVYVKPVKDMLPNKYLKNNTLKVDDNLTLIKINPAWMTRQLSEQLRMKDFNFRITSLNPINPNNKANPFETRALKYIEETNRKEYFEFNKDQFNYMGALVTTKSCIECHASQGYKEGDIRGGISVSLNPIEYFKMVEGISNRSMLIIIFVSLFLVIIAILIHFQIRSNEKLLKVVRDRTKELEYEKNYTNKILNTNPDVIIVTNGTKIITANRSFFDLFGFDSVESFLKEHDCICDYFETLNGIAFPKDKMIEGKIWAEYLLDHLGFNHIVKVKIENNIYFYNLNASRLSDEEILVILTDITDLKKQEEQLIKSERLASMGEMIGNIAHQWRQPLSVISTSATGIKIQSELNRLNQEQLFNLCDSIEISSQYLSKTIDDFRNFIKGDSRPVLFNLKDNTESFLQLVEPTIKKYNIQIIMDIEDDIEIKGYPNELIQCFINIFNNSKDVLLKNQDDNRYIFISQYKKENSIYITFKDNGGGIEKENILKIFEPYFTTKHKSQGTGLGLHMTYKLIVEGMGGHIDVENNVYQHNGCRYTGAMFTIKLPMT
ncbi:MAG: DUF3365 domain-containing protein [Campylobacterota bacterium]|nr:DUF3365 domain-containing protein [Campylobacterota bacterium]